jgi:NAD(P)-dependent dehydrogenase (short-subunit alcohol dehydrogenase family)
MSKYISDLFSLEKKTAIVIGAGGHLCSIMAGALFKAGCSVAILDRDEDNLRQAAGRISNNRKRLMSICIDVTNKRDHEGALEDILNEFGKIDILINGAGINAPTPFFDITIDEWRSIIDVHLTGTCLACQVYGRHMVEKRGGSIINLSSASSGPPLSKAFTYSAAKSGIKNLTQNLAREWAPYNVRVNALRPGFFPTEWSMKNFITSERQKAILGHTPMGRYGKPEELIGAVIWLASDAASFVTGAEIAVDGGFTCMTI